MTKEQKQYKLMIMADLKIVESYYADKEKTLRLHMTRRRFLSRAMEINIRTKRGQTGVNWNSVYAFLCNCIDSED